MLEVLGVIFLFIVAIGAISFVAVGTVLLFMPYGELTEEERIDMGW